VDTATADPARAEIRGDGETRLTAAKITLGDEFRSKISTVLQSLRLTKQAYGVRSRLIEIGREQVRKTVLAYASAHAAAFEEAGLPVDAETEMAGIAHALQVARGCAASLRCDVGNLDPATADLLIPLPITLQSDLESDARMAWLDGRDLIERERERVALRTTPSPAPATPRSDEVSGQSQIGVIDALRSEADWSLRTLAEEPGLDPKAPRKDISGERTLHSSTQRKRITVGESLAVPESANIEMPGRFEPRGVLGRNIDRLRREAGWSLSRLADEAGVDRKAPGKHIAGRRKLYPSTVKKYALALSRGVNRVVTVAELNGDL